MNLAFKRLAITLGLAIASIAAPAAAQEYPSKPIKLQIPFSPGGATDVLARLVGDEFATRLGQPVIAENRPGASTGLAAAYVAKSKPDGYTLLLSTPTHSINAAASQNLPFDAVNDFEFIGKIGQIGFVLMASPDLQVTDLQGLVALARREPDRLKYASSGLNAQGQLWTDAFIQKARINALHIPYKGETQALTDLLGGQVNLFLCTFTVCGPRMNDKAMVPLAVTTSRRFAQAPTVPTVIEAGFPEAEMNWWAFIAAPKGTPPAVIQRLNTTLNEMLADETFKKRLLALGIDPEPRTTAAATRSLIRSEIDRWRSSVVKTDTN
ncbi:tripartite tricarboxylate transporter substrate-binding protein [Variovorax sp. Sphag1AA]|uniref:tripartite tricarboxylate transporter substrate-binding protein n=1 Tax=Variovorax sp. Sphag1AA TaxID=2587027 RepID=UPI001618145D|nr:tripartite tricarboxylate transporter substrate-binding protein [Variovorax sp. Sphag1AA]MBB3181137.1 tripartite-type tricarboxylate transporter receptor subunit TctC [Variovorax sp. Sphag1AA]